MQKLIPELARVSFTSFDDILTDLDNLEAKKPIQHTVTLKIRPEGSPLSPEISGSNTCNKCKKKIIGDKLGAEGKSYHPACFTCTNCANRITASFFPRGPGEVYCVACIEKLNPCSTCGNVIPAGTKYSIDSDGKNHHNDCFTGRKLCVKCKKPVTSVEVKALEKIYHPECFCCTECGVHLEGTFVNANGNPVCRGCRTGGRPLCATCAKPITRDYSEFKGKLHHTECFTCAHCRKEIGSDSFFDVGGKPVCQACDIWKNMK